MKQLLLGNEAVARGLYEAGVSVISSYPGTPSTETVSYTHLAHFSVKDLSGKRKNKKALMEEVGLPYSDEPLVGIVTRMVDHKGLDLVPVSYTHLIQNIL